MATARELFEFLDMTVLRPAMGNRRVRGRLKSNIAFARMTLRRLANRGNPSSIVRYVWKALMSTGGINNYNGLRNANATTFEDVISVLLLLYRR